MNAISQSDFLQALGWAVLNSLWQMALLWVVYQLLTAVLRLQKSSQRATLASSLLFAGFSWFIFTFLLILDKTPQAAGLITLVNITSNNESLNQWFAISLPWASLLYLVLLVLPVLNFIRNYRYVQQIRRHGLTKANVEWRMFVQKVAGLMGINKPVQIWMSDLVSSPVTIGYMKPVILLPFAAVNQLNTHQVEAILLHELSHIRRMDYLTNLFTRIIQTILYFNPFVKAFAQIIEREREKSCDEIVIQFQYEPYGYASALLALEKAAHTAPRPLAVAAAGGKKNELLSRIESILGIQQKPVFSFHKLAGVLSALLCFIALNALVILSKPGKNNASAGFFLSQLSSPLSFVPEDNTAVAIPAVEERPQQIIAQAPAEVIAPVESVAPIAPVPPASAQANNPTVLTEDHQVVDGKFIKTVVDNATNHFIQISNLQDIIPELTPQQEKQVKEALNASKKVLEETQWKAVEKSIADAMTMAEKESVKAAYERAAEKANWEQMANKLRVSYNQIDWEGLNAELTKAMNNIKLDSMRQVYSDAMVKLSGLQKELTVKGLKGIPDSDITLDRLQKKIAELQKARTKVQEMRNRKVIDL